MRKHTTRALLALAFALLLPAAARAIDVTVSSATFSGYQWGGATAKLRVYPSTTFRASDGTVVPGGSAVGQPTGFFTEVNCTVASSVLTCPSVTLKSTTDSTNRPDATYTAVLFDSAGTRRAFFPVSTFRLTHTLGSTVTWGQIIDDNAGQRVYPPSGVYTIDQVNALVASRVSSITGTPNQITASSSTGNVTLSLPQSIATNSNVTFNQVTLGDGSVLTTANLAAKSEEEVANFFTLSSGYTTASTSYVSVTSPAHAPPGGSAQTMEFIAYINPAQWTGTFFSFEAHFNITGGSQNTCQIQLWNATDSTELAAMSRAWLHTYARPARSATFTIGGTGTKRLVVRVKAESGSTSQCSAWSARLVANPLVSECGSSATATNCQ